MRGLRSAKLDPKAEKIYTAGEKEFIAEQNRKGSGIPLNKSLQNDIKIMQKELGLMKYNFDF